ncbi:polyphosphate polymerase domain-containing protein [Clostridium sp. A1-XYC3]|uniref:Polyphosphate polymerase domain-containing protein n=1 Tax=Clostridium tanneri TaxID=3037988 RepID=A0ABU4JY53_9CLOT|nr:polyphosphate polymerase domain-containing protein [Clostridium sp. A1-XYC3]MDW8803098.1 polyphosphate polymerase domain-containing protein [Clostridium sp. A1-XYC3]
MAIEVFNRSECKFLIQEDIYEELNIKLLKHMDMDDHNKEANFYTISNIYYDTEDDYLIRNSLSKPKYKEKIRLRSYGVPNIDGKVYLEIKKKFNGIGNKRRTSLKLNEAYEFLSTGEKPELKSYMNKQVINELHYSLKLYNVEPKLYLAYDRKAMFGRDNREVRITFDTNIRTRRYDLRLEAGNYGEPLLEKGKMLMEVKVEKNIPLWLAKLLSEYKIYKTSFSKYGNEYKKMIMNNKRLKGEMNKCSTQYSAQYQMQQLAHQLL